MTQFRPGSHARGIIELLSTVGEYPWRSLSILGEKRTMQTLIRKLASSQDFRWGRDGEVYTGKLLQLNGKGLSRSIRLHKGAFPILEKLHPDALGYYLGAFDGHNFPSDLAHVGRNHRIAEAAAMCRAAGIEITPYSLPKLQKKQLIRVLPDSSCFYTARSIKQVDIAELSKTTYTRIVGAVFSPGGAYAVYNTRNAVMKWSGGGELKTLFSLNELARMNAGVPEVNSAILVGSSPQVAIATLKTDEKIQRDARDNLSICHVYRHVHFIPMTQGGVDLLRILTLPGWSEKLRDALFEPEMQSGTHGSIEHDAYANGVYYYSHLDGDLARLTRLRSALRMGGAAVEVLCYPWQSQFLRSYLDNSVTLKQLDMDAVLSAVIS